MAVVVGLSCSYGCRCSGGSSDAEARLENFEINRNFDIDACRRAWRHFKAIDSGLIAYLKGCK